MCHELTARRCYACTRSIEGSRPNEVWTKLLEFTRATHGIKLKDNGYFRRSVHRLTETTSLWRTSTLCQKASQNKHFTFITTWTRIQPLVCLERDLVDKTPLTENTPNLRHWQQRKSPRFLPAVGPVSFVAVAVAATLEDALSLAFGEVWHVIVLRCDANQPKTQ